MCVCMLAVLNPYVAPMVMESFGKTPLTCIPPFSLHVMKAVSDVSARNDGEENCQ